MGIKKHPDLNEIQEKLVLELWKTGRGGGEISRELGTSQGPVDRVIFKLGLKRTKQEMLDARKKHGLSFGGGLNGQKITATVREQQRLNSISLWDRARQRTNQTDSL